jgi:hypothetical protein
MRRDYFDANVRNVADDHDRPVVTIEFDGPDGLLTERLGSEDGTLDSSEIDVTYRLTDADEDDDASGVLSIADRLTGDFVLEANLEPDAVFELVEAGKAFSAEHDDSYRLRLVDGGGDATVYDKDTLLVYDADGSLLRQRSLIPGGVEL